MDQLLRHLLDEWEAPIKIIRTGYLVAFEGPQAKQSTSFGGRHAFTPSKKRKYVKDLVRHFRACYDGVRLQGMIRLTVLFCFPWPQTEVAFRSLGWALTDKHIDVDNLLKPVKDSLSGIIMNDDSQVVEVRARKIRYKCGMIAVRVDEVVPNRKWKGSTQLDGK